MDRKCKNNPNKFCYICGKVTFTDQIPITNFVKKSYHAYFGINLRDKDKAFAPNTCCKTCVENLRRWVNKKAKSLPFGVPMVWGEIKDHDTDCYFCMTNLYGFNRKNKHHVKYPNVPSAIKPVPHGPGIPIPTPPSNEQWLSKSEDEMEDDDDKSPVVKSDESPVVKSNKSPIVRSTREREPPIPFTQAELNDLARDLSLSKKSAQLLRSRLKERGFLSL
ncbi:UNVERIFIED_CONTAM: hypothetical protein RMT77_009934 [Armadillidium vulgare]